MKSTLTILFALLLFSSCKKDPCKYSGCLKGAVCEDGTCHYQIEYVIDCNDCNVNYVDKDGELLTNTNVVSHWTYAFEAVSGQYYYITTIKTGATIKVMRDGVLWDRTTVSSLANSTLKGNLP